MNETGPSGVHTMTAMRRLPLLALVLAALALPTLTTLVGCGDDSRTDGTQVQESEQQKAMINDMRDDMLKANKERSKGRSR
jgi:hypothetical protein